MNLCIPTHYDKIKLLQSYRSSQISPLAQNPTTHTIQDSLSHTSHFISNSLASSISSQYSANSFPSFIRSCHPPTSFQSLSTKNFDRSLYHQAPALWNSLRKHLFVHSSMSPTQINYSLLSLSSSQFHKQLKTYVFLQSYPT